MAKTTTPKSPTEATATKYIVTEQDIISNPGYQAQGLHAGDVIETPLPDTTIGDNRSKTGAETNSPNASLNLSRFDYSNLKGDAFKEYLLLVAGLRLDDKYDFEEHVVNPIKEDRFEGVENSPVDVVGIRLKSPGNPERVTRMALKHALAFNGKIQETKTGKHFTISGGQWTEHTNSRCVYYLLKK